MAEGDAGAAGGAAAGDAGAAAAAGGGAADAGAGGTNAAAAGAGAAPGSVLATGAAAAGAGAGAAAAGATPGPFGIIPEKFHVKDADGTPDLQASWAKVEEHRSNLEKRLGSGDIPPKTADEYKINVPTALGEKIKADELAKDPGFKEFIGKLHGAGLSQKQVDVAVGEFLERSMNLQNAMAQMSATETTTKLKEVWKTDAEFQTNVQAAYRASAAYGDIEKLMTKYGNDPDFIQFAAKVGKELSEDTSVAGTRGEVNATKQEHETLAVWLNNSANRNAPEFATKNARYAELGTKLFGTGPKASGSMSFQQAI